MSGGRKLKEGEKNEVGLHDSFSQSDQGGFSDVVASEQRSTSSDRVGPY
jgi:hypothetical protein